MPKNKRGFQWSIGLVWFFAIFLVSAIATVYPTAIESTTLWLILGIAGAVVAIVDIRRRDEERFVHGLIGFLLVVILILSLRINAEISTFLLNLAVGFGVAGLVVSLGLIFKVVLQKAD